MANITRARGAGVATMLLLDRGGAHGDAASAAHSCSAWLHPDHALCCFPAAGCFFAQKVYNAQRAGADVVLIADNRDEPLITMAEPADHPVRMHVLHICAWPACQKALLTAVWVVDAS
jgi:hypothetical protein